LKLVQHHLWMFHLQNLLVLLMVHLLFSTSLLLLLFLCCLFLPHSSDSDKPTLSPQISSASSLTQVENAENARGEACWAPGAGKTLLGSEEYGEGPF